MPKAIPTATTASSTSPPGALGLGRAAVLGEEAELAAQVLDVHPPAVRRAADVGELGLGIEPDLPAGRLEAVAPVRLLAEEEEVLVRRPDLLDRLAPDEQ